MRAGDAVDACGAAPSVVAGGAALAWRTEAGQRTVSSAANCLISALPRIKIPLQASTAKAPVLPDPVDAIVAIFGTLNLRASLIVAVLLLVARHSWINSLHRHPHVGHDA